MMETESAFVLERCRNDGAVSSPDMAGGVVGYFNNTGAVSRGDDVVRVKDCVNTGSVTTESHNGFVGGVIGGCGIKESRTEISGCVNTGDIVFLDTMESTVEEETSEGKFELARMAGGVIGRVGETIYLSTTGDRHDAVEKKDCNILITDCYSCGGFSLPPEEAHKYSDGENEIVNYCGGIVGTVDMEEGYYTFIENCGYANAERGVGNTALPDAGTRMDAQTILGMVK